MTVEQEEIEEKPLDSVVLAKDDTEAELAAESNFTDMNNCSKPKAEALPEINDVTTNSGGQTEIEKEVSEDQKFTDIDGRLERLETLAVEFKESFEQKMSYDRFKEQQIDRLHEELQEYKRDLIGKATRPLVNGVVRLHNNMGKITDALKSESSSDLPLERVFEIIEGFQEDIEILLEHYGIERLETAVERFDPKLQTVVRKVSTTDPDQSGLVIEKLRPGFEQSGSIVQKEKVAVYFFDKSLAGGE